MDRINLEVISSELLKSLLLLFVLLLTLAAANAQTYTQNEQDCFNSVQNKVAYDNAGHKRWDESNIRNLCRGTTNPQTTIACFNSKMPRVGWLEATNQCIPKPAPEQIARVITIKNNAGLQIKGNLWQLGPTGNLVRRAQTGGFVIGESRTLGNGIKIPLDDLTEVEILMQITEGPTDFISMFKGILPRNKDFSTFCYEVTGTYFVPGLKTCDGSEAFESKYFSFKNEALFSAYVNLTYYPMGKTTTTIIRTDTTSLGFQRKIYLPLEADIDKKMTLEIIKTSALAPKDVLLTKTLDLASFDSSCYKVWGTIFSPQAGSCE